MSAIFNCGVAHGNIVIYESFVILAGGPQSGDYYYEMKDNGGTNATFSSINQDINLLTFPSVVLKGGQVRTTASSNDYQNANNRETLNWRIYRDGTIAPSYSTQDLSFLGEQPYPNMLWRKTDMSTSLISGFDSGTYKMDALYTGTGSFFSGSQQYFVHGNDPSSGAYQATFSLYYGATAAGTQPSAFTGTGRFDKSGTGTYVLNQANSYTGVTSITGGAVQLSGSGTLGVGSNVNISNGATLDLNGVSVVVSSVKETAVNNGGTISLGSGTLTINGANKGILYQNSISGTGGITMAGSGTTSLGLYGTQDYSGTTTVSGGKISSAVTMGTLSVVVSGGEFEMTADNKLADAATLSISSGTLDLQGTDTVASLASTGGAITLGSGKTLTVTSNSSIGSSSTVSGGTLRASGGTLTFNSTSGNSSAVTIESSAKLTGTGTIGGATTINASGTLAPTAQVSGSRMTIGSTVNFTSNSIFQWDLNSGSSDPGANALNIGSYGQLAATGAASGTSVFSIVSGGNYSDPFWNTNKRWDNIFSAAGLTNLNSIFTTFSGTGLTTSGSGPTAIATAAGRGQFSFTGMTLQWTAVPEPASTLAGLLLGAGLLRRRRG